jgi:hypothetical protein
VRDAAPSYTRSATRLTLRRAAPAYRDVTHYKEHVMGKYVLAWALGVPTLVVVLAYLVFH